MSGAGADHAPRAILARSPAQIAEVAARAERAPRLALDAEANGMFAFRASLCTMQLAWPEGSGVAIAVVDAIGADLGPLGPVLGPAGPLKVLHDLAFDARLLDEAGITLGNARDTSVAARFLGHNATGLATLLAAELGITIDKRFQQHDWSRRPLTVEQIEYLADDVEHLLALDERLLSQAIERDLRDEIEEECAYRLAAARRSPRDARPAYARIKGAGALDPAGRAALRRLCAVRDQAAESADVPPFKIISNEVLLELSRHRPESAAALRKQVRGATLGRAAAHVDAFIRAIAEGVRDGDVPPEERAFFEPVRLSRAEVARRRALESRLLGWRKAEAKRRGVDEQVVLPGHCAQDLVSTLLAHAPGDPGIAEAIARVPGIGARRLARYGAFFQSLVDTQAGAAPSDEAST